MSISPSIGQIAIVVRDVARATAFYRDAFGLPLLFEAGGMAFFRCGETRLMLSLPSSPDVAHASSILYFRVEDIQARVREMQQRGVQFRREAQLTHRDAHMELWIAFFDDGEGNLMALMEELKPA